MTSQTRPTGAASSSTVREFIYLDTAKVNSYLSQIEGGLRLLVEKVEEENSKTITSDPNRTRTTTSGIDAGIGGAVAALFQANVRVGLSQERLTTTDASRDVEIEENTRRSDLSLLHHKAFDLVMEKLANRLISVTGRTSMIDLRHVKTLLGKTSGTGVDHDPEELARGMHGFELLAELGAELLIYVEESKGQHVHAFGQSEFLTIPSRLFRNLYGSPSERHITIVGIRTQRPEQARRSAPQQVPDGSSVRNVFDALATIDDFLNKFMGIGSGDRLYPLAIYFDIK